MSENENKRIDITSTAIEKALDLTKSFIEKLLGASFEETGLLIADNIKLIRFKNQIRILTKAQKIVIENNIDIKKISLKQLVPLLEYSSLEEDETLQDKWTNLIVNFIDSNENYISTIFPFILNQISTNELKILEMFYTLPKVDINSKNFKKIEFDNLVRLGVIVQSYDDEIFLYNEDEINVIPYYFNITELGKEFFKCCSPRE